MTKPLTETEDEFQGWITDLAERTGWIWFHDRDSRKNPSGFPDLVLARNGRVIFAELKVGYNKPSDAQIEWLTNLGWNNDTSHKLVRLWRPEDRDAIERMLTMDPTEALM